MLVSLRGGRQFLGNGYYVSLVSEVLGKSTREYVGSNAMGARVRVTSHGSKICGLVFANVPDKYPGPVWNGFVRPTQVPIEPIEARTVKGRLAAAYIGTLEQPFLFEYLDYIAPTISSPTEVTDHGDSIGNDLKQGFGILPGWMQSFLRTIPGFDPMPPADPFDPAKPASRRKTSSARTGAVPR